VTAARDMAREGLVTGSVGNVSARTAGGFLITPTRVEYERMTADGLAFVGLDGAAASGSGEPSRESPLHAAIYRARADVGAIVHTHSVHATAWSFLPEPLGPPIEEIEYYGIGPIRTSEPAPAGSLALAGNAVLALGGGLAALLGRHGVVSVGATPQEALTVARVVELQAHVAWLLRGHAT
jgi:L-fuculose-phosphate aldolase